MVRRLPNERDTFLIAGYQAEGTRGRSLLEREPTVRIFAHDVPVRCHVEFISSMSGHADRRELFTWMSNFRESPKITFCVHGEGQELEEYAQAIRDTLGWNVIVPEYLESANLFQGI
jgi:metallo-beta-lactamase family protein